MAYRTVFLVVIMILVDHCQSTNRTEQVIALRREMGEMMIKYGDKINEASKFMTQSSGSASKAMESMKGWHQDVASKAAARKRYIADTLEYLKAFEDALNEEIKMYDESRIVAQEYSEGIYDLENETCASSGRLFHKAAVALNPHTEQVFVCESAHLSSKNKNVFHIFKVFLFFRLLDFAHGFRCCLTNHSNNNHSIINHRLTKHRMNNHRPKVTDPMMIFHDD